MLRRRPTRRRRRRDVRRERRLQGLHGLRRGRLRRPVVQPVRLRGPRRRPRTSSASRSRSVESAADTDYTPNIDSLVAEDCDLIIGVGFLLEDPIQAAAEANPDVNFALVDSSFSDADFAPVTLDNVKPMLFDTAQAAFLAGYLAAGDLQTGKVATFGGIQIPSVTIFMDGFADGVAKYNEDNGDHVQVLGWDKATQEGVFTGDFDSQDDGKNIGQNFIDQGADIIMPVAGPVGLGTASVAEAAGNVTIIGSTPTASRPPEYGPIILTSVMKEIGPAVFDTISEAVDGSFSSDAVRRHAGERGRRPGAVPRLRGRRSPPTSSRRARRAQGADHLRRHRRGVATRPRSDLTQDRRTTARAQRPGRRPVQHRPREGDG